MGIQPNNQRQSPIEAAVQQQQQQNQKLLVQQQPMSPSDKQQPQVNTSIETI